MDLSLVYMTFGNKEEARSIGKVIVQENLVACANIINNVNSLYPRGDFQVKVALDRCPAVVPPGCAVGVDSGALLFQSDVPRLRTVQAGNAHADSNQGEHCQVC